MPRSLALVFLPVLAAVLVAPSAHAATASVAYASEEGFNDVFVVFRAAPGERNRVTATAGTPRGAEQAVTFTDSGVPLRAGRGCQVVSARSVTCRTQRFNGDSVVSVFAGDRDDRVDLRALRLPGFTVSVEGEAGADTVFGSRAMVNQINGDAVPDEDAPRAVRGRDFLVGGDRDDRITGGPDRDRIDGAAGADEIRGDEGDDTLIGGPGADRLECGAGRDRAVLFGRDRVRGCERLARTSKG